MGDCRHRIFLPRERRGVAIVRLDGPIDAASASFLETARASTGAKAVRVWVLDLEQVRYVNSRGMAYLIFLHDVLRSEDRMLLLANPQPKVKVVLEMMGLTGVLKLHRKVSAALEIPEVRRTLRGRLSAAGASRRGS